VIIILLVLANGLFSMSEAALISARKARLQQQAEAGSKGARAALQLADNPNRFLSTVQIGITLIGILSGAYGAAALGQTAADAIRTIPPLARYADVLGLTLVVLVITYFSLVLGELVPKRIALNAAERIAALTARPMSLLSLLAAPLVAVLSFSTEAVLRLVGMRPPAEPPVTEEEVQFMLREGTQAGVFEAAEHDIVANLFRSGDRRVHAMMTYRADIVWLNVDDDLNTNLEKIAERVHAFYPLYRDEQRNIIGMVSVRALVPDILRGQQPDLLQATVPPLYIPENTSVLQALEQFRQANTPVALVINEHGDIEGLTTIADVVESILGEFDNGDNPEDREAIQREDGSWLMDGTMSTDAVEQALGRAVFDPDERGAYQTLGGFVMMRVGRIPQAADFFEWDGLRFEVMDMDGRRVDKVLVIVLPPVDPEADPSEEADLA
jgi:putative hemolysin